MSYKFSKGSQNKNTGVLPGMSFLAYWKSLMTTRGDQQFWKKPAAKDRANSKEMQHEIQFTAL